MVPEPPTSGCDYPPTPRNPLADLLVLTFAGILVVGLCSCCVTSLGLFKTDPNAPPSLATLRNELKGQTADLVVQKLGKPDATAEGGRTDLWTYNAVRVATGTVKLKVRFNRSQKPPAVDDVDYEF